MPNEVEATWFTPDYLAGHAAGATKMTNDLLQRAKDDIWERVESAYYHSNLSSEEITVKHIDWVADLLMAEIARERAEIVTNLDAIGKTKLAMPITAMRLVITSKH